MALPNTNISVSMVKSELGASTNNVGQLCIHPNINKWSKWKPVRLNNVSLITHTDITSVSAGLVIPSVKGYASVIDYYRSNPTLQFIYNKPRGGSFNEPYRLTDFRNYDRSAEIFYDVAVPNYIFSGLLNIHLYSYVPTFPNSDLEKWLDWNFLNMGHLYFGIIIVKKNQITPYAVHYADTPLSVNGNIDPDVLIQAYIDPVPSVDTMFDVFSFIGQKDIEEDDSVYDFYLLEQGWKEVQYTKELIITGTAEYMGGGVEYDINIANNTSISLNMAGVTLMLRYADNGINDELEPLEPFETIVPVGNITIPVSGFHLTDFVENILPELPTRGGYVYFSSTSHNYLNKIIEISYS